MKIIKPTPADMSEEITETTDVQIQGTCTWISPSNIALVKYWGKKHEQLPCNPSISFTLQEAHTRIRLDWEILTTPRQDQVAFEFTFHGQQKPEFNHRIQRFLDRIGKEIPEFSNYFLRIDSENTFPHSSGIASSASAMSALSAALVDMDHQIRGLQLTHHDLSIDTSRQISTLSRLGSGSACRSIYPQAALWGKTSFPDSSDLYAVGLDHILHKDFHRYHDAILLVDQGQKKVSSSAGHELMKNHPYADVRYEEARSNTQKLLDILRTGALEEFVLLTEAEALSLHALMMASSPGYILLHPNTIKIIHLIREFRMSTGLPVCFTLDAGPNIHFLYPDFARNKVLSFIQSELVPLCNEGQWIDDHMGPGIQKASQ